MRENQLQVGRFDGSRIIINAVPETNDHRSALEGCMNYIKENEWPAVAEKLQDYGFPCNLEFKIDTFICGEPSELNEKVLDKSGHVGDKYSQDNYVFNIPYREKGEGVVGREVALQQLHTQQTFPVIIVGNSQHLHYPFAGILRRKLLPSNDPQLAIIRIG